MSGLDEPCVEWTGAIQSAGYGNLKYEGRYWLAHRLAYELEVGPIPKGMVINHLCRNKKCVNVRHLEVTTYKQNTLHGFGWIGDTCKYGHTDPKILSNGKQVCHACQLESYRRHREKKKAAAK